MYYLLKRKERYNELGVNYYKERKKEIIVKQSIKKLEALGLKVTVEDTA
ncbi:transposase [Caldanaerobacter subterraneus subsp. pacificus DSM 12653]|uniref:Transposase n=1 Tax=Caldanaerobacter subterraneus subsp. pacificus DSM 12653 TaxID=391606 RepID=A0A0F5PN81_9THEO|nr:transposase [Caldanaerobacter subterraneus subsp. pacificus DSM 12653]